MLQKFLVLYLCRFELFCTCTIKEGTRGLPMKDNRRAVVVLHISNGCMVMVMAATVNFFQNLHYIEFKMNFTIPELIRGPIRIRIK